MNIAENLQASTFVVLWSAAIREGESVLLGMYRKQEKRTLVLTLKEISAQRVMCSFSHF